MAIGQAPGAAAAIDWAPVDAVLEPFEPGSVLALLDAAAMSPSAVHRLPSVLLLWTRVLSKRPAGARSATAADLPKLLAAARAAATAVASLEDFWPSDPRLEVRFAAGGRRLRLHPGNMDRPVALLTGLDAVAAATDAALVDRHGFGIGDLLEVGLQLCETAITAAEPVWSSGERPAPSALSQEQPDSLRLAAEVLATPATVQQEEVDAARSQLAGRAEHAIAACANPERAARALVWATADAATLAPTIAPGEAILGPILAVDGPLGHIAVPASAVLDGLRAAAEALAATVRDDPACQPAFGSATADRLATVLAGPVANVGAAAAEGTLAAAGAAGSPEAPAAVLVPGRRHAVVLELVAELDLRRISDAVAEAMVRLEGWTAEVLRERLGIPVVPDAEVIPLVIVADGLVQLLVPRLAGGPLAVSLSDLAETFADAAVDGTGRDEVWQFFDELVRPRTVAEVLTVDLLDAWRYWRREGGFLPLNVVREGRDIVVAVPWTLDDPTWRRAAAWEPIEALLAVAGLPPVSGWSIAHLDEPGRATLWMPGEAVAYILGVPHVVATAGVDSSLGQHGIDPAMPVLLASALRDALTGHPVLAQMLGATDQQPLRIDLTVDLTIPQELLVAISTKQRRWRLTAGASFLTALATDNAGAHADIGLMLVTAAVSTAHPDLEPDDLNQLARRRNQEFQRHWATSAPLIVSRLYHSALTTSAAAPLTLPRTRANIVRAIRTLARTLRARGAPPAGRYDGPQAVEVIRTQLRPAIDETLRSELAHFDSGALLDELARHLNNAHGARARRRGELEAGLSAPWAASIRETTFAQHDDAWLTRPLELLVEYSLAARPSGTQRPDRLDVADLAALAEQAFYLGLGAEGADRNLHPLSVVLLDGGLAGVITRDQDQAHADPSLDDALAQRPPHLETPPLDLPAWQRARIADQLRSSNDPSLDDGEVDADQLVRGETVDQAFTPLVTPESPARLRQLDERMRTDLGFGINAILAVLGTAVSLDVDEHGIARIAPTALRDQAHSWSGMPLEELDATVGRLTLRSADLIADGLRYWEAERREFRIAIRPLLDLDGTLLILPWLIRATQLTFGGHLDEGRLPWPTSSLTPATVDAATNFRGSITRALERDIAARIAPLGLPHRTNIEPHAAAAAGIPSLPGEVDLFVADPAHSRLWVIEAKDAILAVSPNSMAQRIRRFTKPNGHVDTLLHKAEVFAQHPGASARLVGAPEPDRPWRVVPLMVTRHVEPAAFAQPPRIAFAIVTDIATVLTNPNHPEPGLAPIEPS